MCKQQAAKPILAIRNNKNSSRSSKKSSSKSSSSCISSQGSNIFIPPPRDHSIPFEELSADSKNHTSAREVNNIKQAYTLHLGLDWKYITIIFLCSWRKRNSNCKFFVSSFLEWNGHEGTVRSLVNAHFAY